MRTPQEEAVEILAQVMQHLSGPKPDLRRVLRWCQHVCELVGWEPTKSWFQQELSGYPADALVPEHRIAHGRLVWQAKGSMYERIERKMDRFVGLEEEDAHTEETVLELRCGIDWVLAAVETGYREVTDETKDDWSRAKGKVVTLQRERTFPAEAFVQILTAIETMAFDFASKSYAQLRYGEVLGDIWGDYRKQVDTALQKLSLGNHLDAIQTALQSDNPESWRAAVFECRSLLEDLAAFLWQDARPTYEHLRGHGPQDKLEVKKDKYKNRLSAYLHQKGLHRTPRVHLLDLIERIDASIRSLIAWQSKAHDPGVAQDARAIALSTYLVLGELVSKTDMQPVRNYGRPAIDRAEGS